MADLHDLLDGPDEELDFEPDEEAATPAASAQRQKAPQAGTPARESPQHRQAAQDRSARAKDPISWSASMDGGSSGGKRQSDNDCSAQRGADPTGKGDAPPKQPKNSVIGFLRQRLSAADTPQAEPARKPALKSQLADKSKAVPVDELQKAASERLDHEALSRTAKRREERKRARGRDPYGHEDMQEPVRKRQISPGAHNGQGGHSRARSHSRGDPLERLRGPFAHEVVPLDAPPYGVGRHQSRPLGPEFRHPEEPDPWLPRSAEREFSRGGREPPPPPPPMHGARFEREWMPPPRGGPGPWDALPFDDRHYDRPPPFDGPPPPPFFRERPFDERPPFDRPPFDRPPFDRPPFERPPPPFRGRHDDRPPLGRPGRSRSPPPPPRRLSPPLRRRSPSPPPPPEVLPPPPPAPGGKLKRSLEEENDRRGYGRQGGYSPPRKRGNAPPSPPHLGLRPQHSGRPSSVAQPREAVPERRRAPSPEARRGSSPARRDTSSAAAAGPKPVPDRKPDPERASGGRQRQDPPDERAPVRSPPRKAAASDDRLGGGGRRAEPSSVGGAAASQTAAPREATRSSGAVKDIAPAQQPAPAKPKAAMQAPASTKSSAQRPGTEQPSSGPSANGSTSGGKAAVKPTATAAQSTAVPARSSEQSSRFTFSTPASEEKLWFYRDTKGVVQGPHSVKEYRSWLQGLERLSTLKPEMARELDEFSSMLLWREGSSKRVPILKVVG